MVVSTGPRLGSHLTLTVNGVTATITNAGGAKLRSGTAVSPERSIINAKVTNRHDGRWRTLHISNTGNGSTVPVLARSRFNGAAVSQRGTTHWRRHGLAGRHAFRPNHHCLATSFTTQRQRTSRSRAVTVKGRYVINQGRWRWATPIKAVRKQGTGTWREVLRRPSPCAQQCRDHPDPRLTGGPGVRR